MDGNPPFLRQLATGYSRCGCHDSARRLLLAVSGGADSMALLHGSRQLWPDHSAEWIVAHVDHDLRGAEGRADADFVRQVADEQSVEFRLLRCDVTDVQAEKGGSVEEVARRLRYQALADCAEQNDMDIVVCAHHQDDQAETVLHNMIRGTGIRGLTGMATVRPLPNGIPLARPLLQTARHTIEDWLTEQQFVWKTDATNLTEQFTRNRIRSQLLPLLREDFNPQIVRSLLRLAANAQDAAELSDHVARQCLTDVVLENQPGVCRLNRTQLFTWSAVAVRAMLRLLWQEQGWPQQGMTHTHWHELAMSLQDTARPPQDLPGVQISVTDTLVRLVSPDPLV